ncbi:MAG: type IV toxin-antitoxin system AbiEi family antitoxin [Acidobacteriota bacterium]
MERNQKMKNIFGDKATLIARKMLKDPKREWVVRDFTGSEGVSLGMAQAILEAMAKKGYVERVKKGPESYTLLTNKDMLIADWLKDYQFDLNTIDSYYSPDKDILKKIKNLLKEGQYALTLHTGANLITSFVKTEEIFIYLKLANWDKDILALRQKLELKELVRGGNIHVIQPYYKTSVFFNRQKIKGFIVVSNLQLYLDLYNFQPRGREHAEYLKKLLEEKGKHFD